MFIAIAPSVAPSLELLSTTSTSIRVRWGGIECRDRNGRIVGFRLSSCDSNGTNCISNKVFANTREITNLVPRTTYSIFVNAYTRSNSVDLHGPPSAVLFAQTRAPESQLASYCLATFIIYISCYCRSWFSFKWSIILQPVISWNSRIDKQ